MNAAELRGLKVGDRVRWVSPGGSCDGVVTEKVRGMARIRWADAQSELIGWRSSHDRARGKNIVLVKAETGP